MFINTKKSFKLTSENGTAFEKRAGWIGEVPKWVEDHWYFKALCEDGSVTAIVSSRDKDIAAALEETGEKPLTDPPKADNGDAKDDKHPVSTGTKTGKGSK